MAIRVKDVTIDNLLGASSKFKVYLGQRDDGEKVIVKVATTFEDNDALAEDAKIFNMLRNFNSHLEATAEAMGADSGKYHLLFANLKASFIECTQKDRRISIFSFPEADMDIITPLPKLNSQVEIDARSSVWILGRFLKFYSFFELLKVRDKAEVCTYPVFSPGDYLISPKQHRLVCYNYSEGIEAVYATEFVKSIARYVLAWTAFGDTDEDIRYHQIVEDLAINGRKTAADAHRDLYSVVNDIWGIHYYPFTYRTRDTMIWKNIEEER